MKLWIGIIVGLLVFGGFVAKFPEGESGLRAAIMAGAAMWLVWAIIPGRRKAPPPPPPPPPSEPKPSEKHEPERLPEIPVWAKVAFWTIVFVGIGYFYLISTVVPTSLPAWDIITQTTGNKAEKPRFPDDMEKYMRESIAKLLPMSEKKESDYAKAFTTLALKNETAQFQEEWTKMINLESVNLIDQRSTAYNATAWPSTISLIVQVICALIAMRLTWSLEGILKFTPTLVIVCAIGVTYFLVAYPPETGKVANGLFAAGLSLSIIESIFGVLGALFTAWRILYDPPAGKVGVIVTIGLMLVGVGIGYSWDSFNQIQLLTSAVRETKGLISIDGAAIFYQLGRVGGIAGIVAIFSMPLAYARAATAGAYEEKANRAQAQNNP